MITFGYFLSPTQWLLVLALVLLFFGAKRLPEIGRALGKSLKEFKEEVTPEKTPGDKAKEVDARIVEEEKKKEQ
ncbi:twin-arginine translocase TatA/TatE family subunit [Heliorestis convoluta]|uniref:Sec-independent protein translocase protein TatA n=1 Tax=Heliorestis convoluta TaxID=356322 RepID=A0A5Q2N3X8_9FIRM|nr:twin-arginine translocase TatA/TatE family subunit [Heliorestis convoluta]QGG49031.1 twin-arginine translocase TatA/TatE family subunit [Heliorestis convoluta]